MTKDKYSDKGDYELLRKSLEAMREHAVAHNVTKIGRMTVPLFSSFLFFIFLVVKTLFFLQQCPNLVAVWTGCRGPRFEPSSKTSFWRRRLNWSSTPWTVERAKSQTGQDPGITCPWDLCKQGLFVPIVSFAFEMYHVDHTLPCFGQIS